MNDIRSLREKIDNIDNEIIALIKKRAYIAIKLGQIKKLQNMPIKDYKREKEIFDRIKAKDCSPLSVESLINIFKEIIHACKALEGGSDDRLWESSARVC